MGKLFHVARILVIVLGVTLVGASEQPLARQSIVLQQDDSPARPGSAEPNLYASGDGRVYLSWIEAAGENRHALLFAVRIDNKWSEPRTIVESENLFVNWADFPSLIALSDGTLVAHWLIKGSPDSHAYDINIARSTDGGKTWSNPVAPHRDGTKSEHGFVSMLPLTGGRAGLIWLDGRNFKNNSHDSDGSPSNEMTLRYATIDSKSNVSEDAVLDPRVCDCCQTSAALTSEGAVVVYRDRSEKEIRDISVVRFNKGRWTEPRTLSADGWEINGCPVNGPSISADGQKVAVAWFTAAKETPRVKVIFSTDAGATFGQPIQVDVAAPVGRVDVSILKDGSALVSWLERTANGGEVKVRRVRPDGARDEAIIVAESSVARVSGFPQMALAGDEIIFAWTNPGTPSRVRTKVVRLVAAK